MGTFPLSKKKKKKNCLTPVPHVRKHREFALELFQHIENIASAILASRINNVNKKKDQNPNTVQILCIGTDRSQQTVQTKIRLLVNRLGGLSLPRKSVVRFTDRPDMTLDVYRGHKTTNQQNQQQRSDCF